jgi:hypothetical protein
MTTPEEQIAVIDALTALALVLDLEDLSAGRAKR